MAMFFMLPKWPWAAFIPRSASWAHGRAPWRSGATRRAGRRRGVRHRLRGALEPHVVQGAGAEYATGSLAPTPCRPGPKSHSTAWRSCLVLARITQLPATSLGSVVVA